MKRLSDKAKKSTQGKIGKLGAVGIFGSGVLFCAGLYGFYRYHLVKSFESKFKAIVDDRKGFFRLHDGLAYGFDNKVDKSETENRIGRYRKSILKFAEGDVLETGVGTSRNLNLYPLDCKVIGVDYSPKMIEVSLQKNSLTTINYALEDLEEMSYADNTFDTVVDTFGLEYYLNPRKVLLEMKRVCKEDGKILLLNMGAPDNNWLKWYYRFNLPYYLLTHGFFPHRPWDKIIKTMGFEIIKAEKFQGGTLYYQILKNTKDNLAEKKNNEK